MRRSLSPTPDHATRGRSPAPVATSPRANPTSPAVPGSSPLRWLAKGYGYEVTGADVWSAYANTMQAAERSDRVAETRERIKEVVFGEGGGGFVFGVLGRELSL